MAKKKQHKKRKNNKNHYNKNHYNIENNYYNNNIENNYYNSNNKKYDEVILDLKNRKNYVQKKAARYFGVSCCFALCVGCLQFYEINIYKFFEQLIFVLSLMIAACFMNINDLECKIVDIELKKIDRDSDTK